MIVENESAIIMEAIHLGISHRVKSAGYSQETSFIDIAISPNMTNSPVYGQILSAGIVKLRTTGELMVILAKYGLTDWKIPSRYFLLRL